jgi:hypothetical protein
MVGRVVSLLLSSLKLRNGEKRRWRVAAAAVAARPALRGAVEFLSVVVPSNFTCGRMSRRWCHPFMCV